jgi:hypothetical protein
MEKEAMFLVAHLDEDALNAWHCTMNKAQRTLLAVCLSNLTLQPICFVSAAGSQVSGPCRVRSQQD